MTGTRFTLVGVLAVALTTPAMGQEGGFQAPINAGPVIPIPTGQAGQTGFYTSSEFVFERPRALGRTLPRTPPDLSPLTAGGFGSFCARGLPRPAEPIRPAQQLYRQLLVLSEPFRPAAEESSAQNILLGGVMNR